MSVEKVIQDGNVLLQENGETVASIGGRLEEGSLILSLQGMLRADVMAYLHNELDFYASAGLPGVRVDCSKITGIAPGCFLELLSLKAKLLAQDSRIQFENKSDALLKFEKRSGKTL